MHYACIDWIAHPSDQLVYSLVIAIYTLHAFTIIDSIPSGGYIYYLCYNRVKSWYAFLLCATNSFQ